jgi:biotin operon repressor
MIVTSMPESGRQANPPPQDLARERRDLIRGLTDEGVSPAEIARELGVSRQAVQKMLAV